MELLFSDEEGAGCCSRVGRQGAWARVDPGLGAPGTPALRGPRSPAGADTPRFLLPREGPPSPSAAESTKSGLQGLSLRTASRLGFFKDYVSDKF